MSKLSPSEISRFKDYLDRLQGDPDFLSLPRTVRESLSVELTEAVMHLGRVESLLSASTNLDINDSKSKQEIWERKLLDLSFRNSLLNIRFGERAVAVDSENAIALFERLQRGEEILVDSLLSSLPDSERKRLTKGLFRLSRTSLDETGANTLFLSIGSLSYFEEDSTTKSHLAPILLIPVNLARLSKDRFAIRKRDEDVALNRTLLEYLKLVAEIEIPLFPSTEDCSLEEVRGIFDLFKRIISRREGWRVQEQSVLGIFSFTKFVMWNDIHSHREVLSSHPILKSLIEGRLTINTEETVDARSLDKDTTPEALALPLAYDSSQLEAVAESDRGSSFVLYGPPGTGKSQTITNLISNALFKGKRVLFVSEKKAALEVVHRRLEKIGISAFCLELHSNKIDRRHFLDQMEKVLSEGTTDKGELFRKATSALYAKRTELIDHIESMHAKREGEWSLVECIERYLSISEPCFELPEGWGSKKREEDILAINRQCLALDASLSILGMPLEEFPLYQLSLKKHLADSDRKNLKNYLNEVLMAIESAQKQESSDMNRKFMKKTVSQILTSDYRWRRLSQLVEIDNELAGDIPALKAKIASWLGSMDLLSLWQRYNEPIEQLEAAGLANVIHMFQSGSSGKEAFNSFLKSFYLREAKDKIRKDPNLSRFKGMLFEQVIDAYKKEVSDYQELVKSEILNRLVTRIHSYSGDPVIRGELTYLRKRIASKGRGVSIRGMMGQIPDLMPLLCPCMMMSPLSVAQFLPADSVEFDLVVFDEASQMPTNEAVGAIARSRSVIVVGDPKQMPPTDFFSADLTGEDEYEIDDLDSILDDCIALDLASHRLEWHYRSKHESLISFSNREYYNNTLVTFPSVDNQVPHVIHRHVDGVYDYGKTRTNRAEAEAIVKEALDRLRDDDTRSIGIVAFSKSQSDLIEDILIDSLSEDGHLESKAFQGEEPLFVKNLENVQGDERDVILFSVCYGPDEKGNVSMNFGPLNKVGGERRLNVALTRARSEMVVFSTLESDQIDSRRTKSEGALGLKRFLEFADGWNSNTLSFTETFHSEIISKLASSISEMGYIVHSGVGSSSFKLDLAVVDPNNPDKYCLGIILDGEDYYRLKTVRDREVVRPGMLERLGWKISRVWILDWFLHPEQVLRQIKDTLKTTV